jgi:primosomal protein N' (replication factor Y)
MKILQVALDVPLDTLFDYAAGEEDIPAGTRVRVPFGRGEQVGIVVGARDHSDLPPERIKPVREVLRDTPPLTPELLRLLQFCASYYHHPLGEVIFTALPSLLRRTHPLPRAQSSRFLLTDAGRAVAPQGLPAQATVKRALLERLRQAGSLDRKEIADLAPTAPQCARELVRLGWLREEAGDAPPSLLGVEPDRAPELTPAQRTAVEALRGRLDRFQVWLLHGVTGGGKTEVYLRLIGDILQRGGQVLVLVPEINLTPQLEQRFAARFPDASLIGLHSRLSAGERLHHWLLAQAGRAQIVLGTRLAVFAPLPRLGLIIVDEEHDGSFKQQDGLRYSARDVAILRAKQAGVPVILGSATPALETYHNALTGRYRLLTLPHRAGKDAALPRVRHIDLRRLPLDEGLSEPLVQAVRERLSRGEQSLIFINRRGFAPVLRCGQCGWISTCHRCSTRMVVHLRDRRLRCHHCGHETRIPTACPDCGNADLAPLGEGTQRVENALERLFPAARILRVDRDSTRRKSALPDMLGRIHRQQVDIIVGTQILAKGHDFKNLSLVGVLNADSALYSADFRASERLFAQLMQVAGRAGRADIPGEVLIQTEFPDHPLFAALARHDYGAFARALLEERRQAGFPPYCHQALLRAEASRMETALQFLVQAQDAAHALSGPVTVFDPVPAQMARLAGRERAQLLVQSTSRTALQVFLSGWHEALKRLDPRRVRWSLDVDPLEF